MPGVQFITVISGGQLLTMADEKQGGGGEENGEGMPIITGQDSNRITPKMFSC